ncbi:hypothetical protein [Mesorhizobium sp. Mes31]|uniref:hypothetical protein n=1 Tax=Mesorhizobium sp. Mes31 TaxID=2926017 RepID=UPI002119578C|nr:hypothetical protein [Mesorhizobium sp. Mes31]
MQKLMEMSSTEARNLVRGIIASRDEAVSADVIDRLYSVCTAGDLQIALAVIAESQTEGRVIVSLPFPTRPPRMGYLTPLDHLSQSALTSLLVRRMIRHTQKLKTYLAAVADLNRSVEEMDTNLLQSVTSIFANEIGFSFHINRKYLCLSRRFANNSTIISAIRPYTEIIRDSRDALHRAVDESYALDRDYIDSRRMFLRLANDKRLSLISRRILHYHFSPFGGGDEGWVQHLRALSSYSLPDALMFILESRILGSALAPINETAERFNLPVELSDSYLKARTKGAFDALTLETTHGPLDGQGTFCMANAWLSDERLAKFYAPIERYAGPRFDGIFGIERPFFESTDHNSLVRSVMTLRDMQPSGVADPTIVPDDEFQRTLRLAHLVEHGYSLGDCNGLDLVALMNATQNVPHLLSEAELDAALPPKSEDNLYEFIRASLKFEASPKISSEFNMRSATEKIVIDDFDRSILSLLKFIHKLAPEVAKFYMAMWNESFLIQCYKLYKSAYEVNEASTMILEWYGHQTDNNVLLERARSLALENKLALIRHDIDSQRLYVDSVRFKQWMFEKLAGPLRQIDLTAVDQGIPDQEIKIDDQIEILIDPSLQVASLVDAAYNEFCCNKAYGVDSYIGRRIRHGTFHGTLIKSASDLVEELLNQCGSDRVNYEYGLRSWLSKFGDEVKLFPRERLQVRSEKKPRGLLVPHVRISEYNLLEFAVRQVCESMLSKGSIPEAIDIIFQSCWLLLQPNLTEIQRELERWRGEKLLLRKEDLRRTPEPGADDDQARAIVRRVNEKVAETLQQISAWFAAPKETTPSATLQELFQVVRMEVAEQVAGFAPEVSEPEESGTRIVGHRYQYVYDALYILVHNAARYGLKGGSLELSVSEKVDGTVTTIYVTVASQFEVGRESYSRARIEHEMAAPMDDALVTEGSTGIRKLRALTSAKTDISDVAVSFSQTGVAFTFRLTLTTL